MLTPERAVQTLAEWSYLWSRQDDSNLELIEFSDPYLNHYRVMATSELDRLLVIDMQLGAFDHGAGNGVLMFAWGDLVWLYEGEVSIIASVFGSQVALNPATLPKGS